MEIKKAWEFSTAQTITISGKRYNVHECIAKASDLEVLELDVSTMNIAYECPNNNTVRSFVEHMKSVMDADLSYPIILNEDGSIIDGRHRLCKALYLGEKTIKAKRFNSDDDTSFELE